jgi:hypothetical protein
MPAQSAWVWRFEPSEDIFQASRCIADRFAMPRNPAGNLPRFLNPMP